ncbi:MAG: hypothetical protein KF805_16400 [Phycisphaeraceae bacterium]|nr:hypothetical protein [Phycisphaeraceae bacterium]
MAVALATIAIAPLTWWGLSIQRGEISRTRDEVNRAEEIKIAFECHASLNDEGRWHVRILVLNKGASVSIVKAAVLSNSVVRAKEGSGSHYFASFSDAKIENSRDKTDTLGTGDHAEVILDGKNRGWVGTADAEMQFTVSLRTSRGEDFSGVVIPRFQGSGVSEQVAATTGAIWPDVENKFKMVNITVTPPLEGKNKGGEKVFGNPRSGSGEQTKQSK